MEPSSPSGSDPTSIRLLALEERVRLLEAAAPPATRPAEVAGISEPRSARSTRGTIAARLAALGHPSRLELLDGVVGGGATTADLAAALGTGSTGQLYHHLNQLVATGWLRTTGRGRYEIPAEQRDTLATVLALVSPTDR